MKLASRLSKIEPSMTLAVSANAAELRSQGLDVIGFGAGEPDFGTPSHIREAAKTALDKGATRYTNVPGTPELRKAVAGWLSAAHDVPFSSDQVIVSVGAKHSLFNLFLALLDPGDEVLIPAPYWVSYPEMVKFASGNPVVVETKPERGFCATAEALEAAVTDRTRALILNSPSNPTGGVYSREDLAQIAELCVRRDILVISDDIYRLLVYGVPYCHILNAAPQNIRGELRERTVLVDGVSKCYAMTGWRIGFLAGPQDLVKGMTKIQGQSTSNPAAIAQAAALTAITGPQDCVAEMGKEFDLRRIRMVQRLRDIPGVECTEPKGAFYVFPDLRAFVGKRSAEGKTIETDLDLATYLLEAGQVAIVPGCGFGAPGFARLSYATSMELIDKGLDRMGEALGKLS